MELWLEDMSNTLKDILGAVVLGQPPSTKSKSVAKGTGSASSVNFRQEERENIAPTPPSSPHTMAHTTFVPRCCHSPPDINHLAKLLKEMTDAIKSMDKKDAFENSQSAEVPSTKDESDSKRAEVDNVRVRASKLEYKQIDERYVSARLISRIN